MALKTLILTTHLALAASVLGCEGETPMTSYTPDTIRSIEASAESGALVISVKPMLESAFYLAGANVSEANGRIELRLVRCRISSNCPVDTKAETTPGGDNPFVMSLDSTDKPVDVVFEAGDKQEIYTP